MAAWANLFGGMGAAGPQGAGDANAAANPFMFNPFLFPFPNPSSPNATGTNTNTNTTSSTPSPNASNPSANAPFPLFNPFLSGFGGAGATSPADSRPPEERYASQLQSLRDMGFTNAQQNVRALLASGGDVQAAVEYILSGGGV